MKQSLREEITADDGPEIYQRLIMHKCLIKQLDGIQAAIDSGSSRADLLTLIGGYQTEYLSYDTLARDAVNASGVTIHIPEHEYAQWTRIYAEIPIMDRVAEQETKDIGRLNVLRRTGGPLSDAEKDRVLDAAGALHSDETLMNSAGGATLKQILNAGLKLDPARIRIFTGWARAHYSGCLENVPLT